ncbi:unnamed protein product [Mytilus edulis]|uniref:C-type lectin domain-containing protein n=1 Tax=Mytilus edulis TaxID=6550 RepID=A0A8S3QVW2_MYTED|nr:unnamed protein product [Mytilus edulis]
MPKSAQKGVVLGSYVTERSTLRILCTRKKKLESNPFCKCQHIYHRPSKALLSILLSSCHEHNARLAEVHSKPQSDFLVNLAKTYGPGQSYWLGGRDDVIEGIWMWASTDQVFNYTDWYPGEPSNSGGNENCLVYGAVALKWNDTPCRNAYRFICEKE